MFNYSSIGDAIREEDVATASSTRDTASAVGRLMVEDAPDANESIEKESVSEGAAEVVVFCKLGANACSADAYSDSGAVK